MSKAALANDDMVIRFARALGVSSDAILGHSSNESEPDTPLRISMRLQKIQMLPQPKQKTVLQALDLALRAVIAEE